MNVVMTTIFGSRLYGTKTPNSDTDYKSVYIPCAKDIILHTYQPVINRGRNKGRDPSTAKNTADDVDHELFALDKYVELLLQNQTIALDIAFSQKIDRMTHPCWAELISNLDKFRSKNVKAFLGYCRQQANKYGIKGSRVAAVDEICRVLSELDQSSRLKEHETELFFLTGTDHIEILDIEVPNQNEVTYVKHLSVCNRKVPFTIKVSDALKVFTHLQREYGERSRLAANNENIDWKALSHAVRIGRQSIEYLYTGKIIFPRPDAHILIDIKLGRYKYAEVANEIEGLLTHIEEVASVVDLPDEPNRDWAQDFVYRWYLKQVKEET